MFPNHLTVPKGSLALHHPLSTIHSGCICAVLLIFSTSVLATSPRLTAITPLGAQRGTELELTFGGERLQDTEEILCFEPGLQVVKLNSITNASVKAQIKIAGDCQLGEHHLRLRTATGFSELLTFQVGPFPVIEEKEPNNVADKAQKVALNTTISGVVANEDIDCFAIEAKKGQRISAEVQAIRLGRSAFDSRLTVLDPSGAVVADADDTWLGQQDPFTSFLAPKDGTYIVQLREITYAGNDNSRYLLHVGTFPRPTVVYPLGGKAGETVKFSCYSAATGEFIQEIKLPDTAGDKFGFFPSLENVSAPTPNWMRVSPFPNILASSTNHTREHATVTELQPPLALNGIIAQTNQEHWFRFNAAKGVGLDVEAYARRLRSPLDPVIEVFDSTGKSLGSNDDSSGADSSLKFTPPETTNYFLRIRDTLREGGPDFAYRVELTPTAPSITVKIPEVSRNDTQSRQFVVVPRGNRFATLISAKRANLAGELEFEVPNLPTGVRLLADRMAANIDSMPLVFEAAADAPIAGKLLDLTATGTNSSGKVVGIFGQRVELVQGPPNNTTYYATKVDKFCVAVAKEAPFHIRIVEPKVPLVQAGTMPLEIVAERAAGFEEPIEVHMVWNPPGVSSQPEATIAKGATNVIYQLNAGGGAETRTWKIAVLGHSTVEGGQVYVSSQLTDLEIAKPFLTGKIETLWVNPGKPGKLTVNLDHPKPFEGKATVRLVGLPEKVTTTEKEITKDDQEVIFDLTVDPKCPTGSHKNLFCAVDVKQEGHVIPHNIAHGGILRIVPPKKEEPKKEEPKIASATPAPKQ